MRVRDKLQKPWAGERSGASAESRHLKKRRKEVRRSADAPLRRNRIRRSRAVAAPRKPESKAHEMGFRHRLKAQMQRAAASEKSQRDFIIQPSVVRLAAPKSDGGG